MAQYIHQTRTNGDTILAEEWNNMGLKVQSLNSKFNEESAQIHGPLKVEGLLTAQSLTVENETEVKSNFTVGGSLTVAGAINSNGTLLINNQGLIGPAGEQMKIGNVGHNGYAGVAHSSQATATGYALLQHSNGTTYLNSAAGKTLHIREGNANRIVVKTGGNVGIGVADPSKKLEVRDGDIRILRTTGDAQLQLTDNGVRNWYTRVVDGADRFAIADDASEFLSINGANGNVGIGTSEPTQKLDVDGFLKIGNGYNSSINMGIRTHSGSHGILFNAYPSPSMITGSLMAKGNTKFGSDLTQYGAGAGGIFFASNGGHMFFNISPGSSGKGTDVEWGTPKLLIKRNGHVGISTTPAAPLSISGDGKENYPDETMHITNDCILLGGNNAGKHHDSAQISAGKHKPNSLNIVGMSSGTSGTDRRVDFWAEGGLNVRGPLVLHNGVMFSAYVASNDLFNALSPLPLKFISNNLGNGFSTATNKFTAPIKGVYMFTMILSHVQTVASASTLNWHLRLNGVYINGASGGEKVERGMITSFAPAHTGTLPREVGAVSRTVFAQLNVGDQVWIQQTGTGRTDNYRSGLEGVLLYAIP